MQILTTLSKIWALILKLLQLLPEKKIAWNKQLNLNPWLPKL